MAYRLGVARNLSVGQISLTQCTAYRHTQTISSRFAIARPPRPSSPLVGWFGGGERRRRRAKRNSGERSVAERLRAHSHSRRSSTSFCKEIDSARNARLRGSIVRRAGLRRPRTHRTGGCSHRSPRTTPSDPPLGPSSSRRGHDCSSTVRDVAIM